MKKPSQGATSGQQDDVNRQLQEQVAQLSVLNEIGQAVSRQLELDRLLETIYEQVQRVMQVGAFFVGLYDEQTGVLTFPLVYDNGRRHDEPDTVLTPGSKVRHVIDTGEPLLVNRTPQEVESIVMTAESAVGDVKPSASLLYVPLPAGQRTIGVLSVQSYEFDAYDEDDVTLLAGIAGPVANAIANARLFELTERARAETEEQAHRLALLNEMSEHLNRAENLDEIFQIAAGKVAQIVPSDRTSVGLLNAKGDSFEIIALHGEEGVTPTGARVPADGSDLGVAVRDHLLIVVSDDEREGLGNIRSFMVAPLFAGGRAIGTLNVASKQPNVYTQSDGNLLLQIASLLSSAIENKRLLEETRSRAEEMAVLNELAQAFTARLNVEQLMEEVYRGASRLMDVANFYIGLYDAEKEEITFPFVVSESEIDRKIVVISADQGIAGHIVRNCTNLLFEDNVRERQEALGITMVGEEPLSWLGVPMIVGDRVLGVIAAQSFTTPRAYDEHSLGLLTAIASQAAVAIQNALLFEEANSRAERLAVVNRIASAAGATLDLDELLETVHQEIGTIFRPDSFFIALYEEEANELDFLFIIDEGVRGDSERLPLGGFTAVVINEKKPLVVRDLEQEQDRLPVPVLVGSGKHAASWLGAPMLIGERVLGVISVQSYRPNVWDEEDEQLLLTIADQVAVALDKAQLFQERERRVTELAIVNEIGRTISVTLELDELCALVHQQVGRIFDASNFYIAAYEEEYDEWAVAFWMDRGQRQPPGRRRKLGEGLTSHIIRSRQPLVFHTTEEILAFHKAQGLSTVGEMNKSWVGVPLIAADKVVGVMSIQDYEHENLYSEPDLALFSTVAGQVATAVGNMRLLEQTRHRAQELEVINEIGRTVTSVLDLDTMLRQIVDVTKSRFGYYFVGIALLEGNRLLFRSGSTVGDSDARHEGVHIDLAHGPSLNADAARTGQPVLVNDVLSDPRYLEAPELPDTRSELSVPIKAKGRVIGVLDVQSDQLYAYTQADAALLQSLANQAGAALENARLFEEARIRAEELAVLNELGQALTTRLSVDKVLEEAYRQASRLVDTTNFYIGLYDAEKHEIHFAFDVSESEIDSEIAVISADQGLAGYIVRNRTSVLLEDNVHQQQEEMGIKMVGQESLSWLGVPLIVGDRVLGAMAVHSFTTPNLYDEHNRDLLTAIASQVAIALQNAYLFEETQAALTETETLAREQTVLNELGQALTARLSVDKVLEEAYRQASRLVDTTEFFIGLYDAEKDEIAFPFNVSKSEIDKQITVVSADQGISGYIVRNRTSVLFGENVLEQQEGMGIKAVGQESLSWLGVPLLVGDRVLGAMVVQSYTTPGLYDEHDRNLLTAIASQVAIALHNAYLFEETETALAQAEHLTEDLTVLNELGRALTTRLSVDQVLEEAYRGASLLLNTTNFYIGLYDPEQEQVRIALNVTESEIEREITVIPVEQGITGYIIRNRADLLLRGNVAEQLADMGIEFVGEPAQAWLGVPMVVGDRVLGMMAAQSYTTPMAWDEHDRDMMTAIARQVAIALQNAYLFGETEAALAEAENLAEALRVSEERFALAMQGSNEGLWDWDMQADTLYWSPRFKELLGYHPDELDVSFEVFESLMHPDDSERVGAAIDAHLKERVPYDVEERLRTKSGEYRWLRARGQALWDEGGNPVRMTGSIADITERKQAEEALRVSEERFALAAQGSNDGLWDWDIQNETLYWSPRLKELLGYADDELDIDFDTFASLLHPDDKETGEALEAHLKDRVPYDIEQRLRTKSGEYRWVRVRGQAVWGEAGQPTRMAGSSTDITERKAEEVERERLLAETETLARERAILNELGQALTARLSVDEVLEETYRQASRLVDTTNFYVGLYDAEKDEVTFPFIVDESEVDNEIEVMSSSEGITGYIIRHRTSVLLGEEAREWEEEVGIEMVGQDAPSWLGVPLMVGDRVIGVMVVQSYTTPNLYTEHDRDLLTAIATHTALAIQNAGLFQEAQARAEELAVLNEMARDLTALLDVDAVVENLYHYASRLIDTSHFYIALYDAETDMVSFPLYIEEGQIYHSEPFQSGRGLTGYVIQTREPLLLEENVAAQVEELGIEAHRLESVSWLGVPMTIGGRVIGVINAHSHTTPRLYNEHHRDLLVAIASQAAIAIENARLFQQAEEATRQMGQRVEELDTLNDIGRKIEDIPPTPEFLHWVTERIPPAMQHPEACVAAIEFEGQVYGAIEATTLPNQVVQSLIIGRQPVGRMHIAYTEAHDFAEEESALLGDIARRVSSYIENQGLLQETHTRAEELATLNEMARALTTTLDIDAVIDNLYEYASRLIDTTNFYVALYDSETDEVWFPFYSESGQIRRAVERRKARKGMTEHIIHTRQPLLIKEDVNAHLVEIGIELIGTEAQSWLGVPLAMGEQVIGVIAVQSYTAPHVYTERHRDLLITIASQAAVALQNARLFQQAEEATRQMGQRVKELDTLNDIGRKIDEIPPISEFLHWVAENIPPAMQHPDTCLAAIEFEDQVYGAAEATTLPNQIVQSLLVARQPVGRVHIAYTEERDFAEQESALLGDIARRVSGYIENQRLLQEAQSRAERERLVRTMTDRVHRSTDTEAIMRTGLRDLSRMLGTSKLVVRLGSREQLCPAPSDPSTNPGRRANDGSDAGQGGK